jgi:predicted RNA-binding Zn ribbon-like protein
VVSQRPAIEPKRQDAPGALELVREFINTRDLEHATDTLADLDGLRTWLSSRDLLDISAEVTESGRAKAIQAREALRALARTNTGHTLDPEVPLVLNQLSSAADVRIRYRDDGSQTLAPRQDGGIDQALGQILAIVGTAALDGTWKRLKVCPAEDCLWAFYDHSRNRSGIWCQMAECGNRSKVRAFRTRHT